MAGGRGRNGRGGRGRGKRQREVSSEDEILENSFSQESSKDEDFVSSPRYRRRSSRAIVAKPTTLRSPVRNMTKRTTRQSSRRNPNKEPTLPPNRENMMPCTSKQPEVDLISNSQAASSRYPSPEIFFGDSLPIILADQAAPVPDFVATAHENDYVDIQGTTNFTANTPHSRCLSRTNSNMSINVTEFAKRLRDEIDDEIESAPDSGLEDVRGYKVKPEFSPLLRCVFDKHGDIAAQTVIESPNILSNYLQQLCRVCEHLERTKFVHIKRAELDSMLADVHDFERAKLNVGWLKERLEDIARTWTAYQQYYNLKEELGKYDGSIRSLEMKLDACKSLLCDVQRRIIDVEGELEAKRAEAGPIRNVVLDTKAKVKSLAQRSLVDGLY